MSEMVRVGVVSTGTFDEATGTYPEILTVHYTGPGRIKYPSMVVSEKTPVGQVLASQDVTLSLPVGFTSAVEISFTYGHALAPEGLKRWAMVLVSQVMVPLELKLGLTVGGLSSVAIDDFKAAFADAGEATGISLSDRNIEMIRRQYSTGTHVVGMR